MLVLKDTAAERLYRHEGYQPLEMEAYVETLTDFIERLEPRQVLQRVTAEAPAEMLIAPRWPLHKAAVLQRLAQTLQQRDTWQGRLYSS